MYVSDSATAQHNRVRNDVRFLLASGPTTLRHYRRWCRCQTTASSCRMRCIFFLFDNRTSTRMMRARQWPKPRATRSRRFYNIFYLKKKKKNPNTIARLRVFDLTHCGGSQTVHRGAPLRAPLALFVGTVVFGS